MPFIATQEIGGYKPGEVVPDEKAKVWLEMWPENPPVKAQSSPVLIPTLMAKSSPSAKPATTAAPKHSHHHAVAAKKKR